MKIYSSNWGQKQFVDQAAVLLDKKSEGWNDVSKKNPNKTYQINGHTYKVLAKQERRLPLFSIERLACIGLGLVCTLGSLGAAFFFSKCVRQLISGRQVRRVVEEVLPPVDPPKPAPLPEPRKEGGIPAPLPLPEQKKEDERPSPLPQPEPKNEDGLPRPLPHIVASEKEAGVPGQLLEPGNDKPQSKEASTVSASQAFPRRFPLAQLTEGQREAGMGRVGRFGSFPPHYSSWFREHAQEFHSERGLHWPDEMMQRFFEEGLLKFYMGEELLLHYKDPLSMLIDCSYNYSQMSSTEDVRLYFRGYERQLFRMCAKKLGLQGAEKWTDEELVDRVRPSAEVAKELINTLWRKEALPKSLVQLGGSFQMAKRQTEELSKQLLDEQKSSVQEKEALQQKLLEQDRRAELMQQVLYHWIHALSCQLSEFLRSGPVASLRAENFSYRIPEFFQDPEYQALLR